MCSIKIKAKNNLAIGTQIRNTANIYFDFNSTVVTNTTLNEVTNGVGINEVNSDNNDFTVYPNPTHDQLYFNNKSGLVLEKISIYDMEGRIIISTNLNSKNGSINVSAIQSGIYLLEIDAKNINGSIAHLKPQRFIKY